MGRQNVEDYMPNYMTSLRAGLSFWPCPSFPPSHVILLRSKYLHAISPVAHVFDLYGSLTNGKLKL